MQKMKAFTIMAICFWHYDITPVFHLNSPNIVSKRFFLNKSNETAIWTKPPSCRVLQCECKNRVQRQTKMVQLTEASFSPVTYLV
jgi:hypothetical protein